MNFTKFSKQNRNFVMIYYFHKPFYLNKVSYENIFLIIIGNLKSWIFPSKIVNKNVIMHKKYDNSNEIALKILPHLVKIQQRKFQRLGKLSFVEKFALALQKSKDFNPICLIKMRNSKKIALSILQLKTILVQSSVMFLIYFLNENRKE